MRCGCIYIWALFDHGSYSANVFGFCFCLVGWVWVFSFWTTKFLDLINLYERQFSKRNPLQENSTSPALPHHWSMLAYGSDRERLSTAVWAVGTNPTHSWRGNHVAMSTSNCRYRLRRRAALGCFPDVTTAWWSSVLRSGSCAAKANKEPGTTRPGSLLFVLSDGAELSPGHCGIFSRDSLISLWSSPPHQSGKGSYPDKSQAIRFEKAAPIPRMVYSKSSLGSVTLILLRCALQDGLCLSF